SFSGSYSENILYVIFQPAGIRKGCNSNDFIEITPIYHKFRFISVTIISYHGFFVNRNAIALLTADQKCYGKTSFVTTRKGGAPLTVRFTRFLTLQP
ncbi:MAG: hypothetical protein J1F09_05095, partial [Oscillospiraceae bacterium]|nr:hypothetical protein [Oscillospiraceae bacterium]